MHKAKRIILLGATGSIGSNTLEIIQQFPDDFQLVGISAHKNSQALSQIAKSFQVPSIALSDEAPINPLLKNSCSQITVKYTVGNKLYTN